MRILNDYLRLIVFCIGLLMGVQVPALVDQYTKRVDAKLLESGQNLAGFQQTADRYFSGDIQKLINYYFESKDIVFKQDAANIQAIFQRVETLKNEMLILQEGGMQSTFHVIFAHDKAIMQETLSQYSYALILDPAAAIWGVSIAILLSSLIEGIVRLLFATVRHLRQKRVDVKRC